MSISSVSQDKYEIYGLDYPSAVVDRIVVAKLYDKKVRRFTWSRLGDIFRGRYMPRISFKEVERAWRFIRQPDSGDLYTENFLKWQSLGSDHPLVKGLLLTMESEYESLVIKWTFPEKEMAMKFIVLAMYHKTNVFSQMDPKRLAAYFDRLLYSKPEPVTPQAIHNIAAFLQDFEKSAYKDWALLQESNKEDQEILKRELKEFDHVVRLQEEEVLVGACRALVRDVVQVRQGSIGNWPD